MLLVLIIIINTFVTKEFYQIKFILLIQYQYVNNWIYRKYYR
jgi:hypothetical protein